MKWNVCLPIFSAKVSNNGKHNYDKESQSTQPVPPVLLSEGTNCTFRLNELLFFFFWKSSCSFNVFKTTTTMGYLSLHVPWRYGQRSEGHVTNCLGYFSVEWNCVVLSWSKTDTVCFLVICFAAILKLRCTRSRHPFFLSFLTL